MRIFCKCHICNKCATTWHHVQIYKKATSLQHIGNQHKKAVINIKNSNEKCFMWSILTSLHPVHWKNNPERIHYYQTYKDELDFDEIEFLLLLTKLRNLNVKTISLLMCLVVHTTKMRFDTHVNLSFYSSGPRRHYYLIKDLNKLLYCTLKINASPNVLLPLLSAWVY